MLWECSRTLRSATTMSTSDPQFQLDESAIKQAQAAVGAALPDVAALTQMANAFFRAIPGQEAVSTTPIPGAPSNLPQSGIPAPSMPSIPSIDKLPNAADLARLANSDFSASYPAE